MLQKLQKHIADNFPFLEGKKLLLAVSGGVDSVVLLYLFDKMKCDIGVAHCNFQLRGVESDGDEKFVEKEVVKCKKTFFVNHFNTKEYAESNKLSIQVAARELRYNWFEEIMNIHGYDYLLTAHHLDDSLETFLINLTRGTGLDGLVGIPKQNDRIIRPLLIFSREEIESFAEENHIQWREDSSNASDKYLRNKLRHDVIPVLKELNPSLLSSFEKTTKNILQAQHLVDDAVKIMYKEVVLEEGDRLKITISKLTKLSDYRAYLYQWLQEFGFSAWEDIYDLVTAQSGKQVYSTEYGLLKDRDFLILYPLLNENEGIYFVEQNQKEVNLPLKITFCEVNDVSNVATNTIFVDENKLKFPLTLRRWQQGDSFCPFGMIGKKKLSKFFKDEKMSLLDKSGIWLLCSDNQIVWVIGKRQDNRFKVTNNTTKILQINIIK